MSVVRTRRPAVGRSLLRTEDARLLTGQGRFVGDIEQPRALSLAVVRSDRAHARLLGVELEAARQSPGVVRVLSGEDLRRLRPQGLRAGAQPALALEEVCYVGQPVAAVLASDRYLAEDAVDLVRVRYESLPVVTDAVRAAEAGAARTRSDTENNLQADETVAYGDIEKAFEHAEIVLEEELSIARASAHPLEGRAILVRPTPQGGIEVFAAHQSPHGMRRALSDALALEPAAVRVIAPDVGGGFGVKNGLYPEDVLAAHLALDTQAAVRFVEDRREHFISTVHAREQLHRVRLGALRDGTLLGLDDVSYMDVGAYGARIPLGMTTASTIPGPYHLPAYRNRVLHVCTNKVPTGPYRGAGRPEGNFVMERMMDRLAAATGLDPLELRRRNLIRPEEMPYTTGIPYRGAGRRIVYDAGDFPALLERLRQHADYDALRRETVAAAAQGRHLGVGVAVFVEDTGVGPFETAAAELGGDGRVLVRSGAPAQGQGHETVFAQIAADALGLEPGDIDCEFTDTAQIDEGIGTFGSRAVPLAGAAVHQACAELRARILGEAAARLQAASEDLELDAQGVRARYQPASGLTLGQVARGRQQRGQPPLRTDVKFEPSAPTYASGAHLALVEVAAQTGAVRILRYVVIDDCGRVINPQLADAQLQGGVMYGISTALLEELVYDEAGQLRTQSFMDYLLPTTHDVPRIEIAHLETPTPLNPLGAKGIGEGGTIPALAALASAVEDALRPYGAVVRRLPMRPEQLRAMIARGRPPA